MTGTYIIHKLSVLQEVLESFLDIFYISISRYSSRHSVRVQQHVSTVSLEKNEVKSMRVENQVFKF